MENNDDESSHGLDENTKEDTSLWYKGKSENETLK